MLGSRALLVVACFALSAYFVRTVPEISGDGRLAFVYAVVDHHSLEVDRYASELPMIREDLALYGGHEYMAKPPLPSLVAVPVYAALRLLFPPAEMDSHWWRWILTLFVSGLSLVATALLVERIAIDARLPSPRLAALATAVATPLAVYATLFIATTLSAALFAALALAARHRRNATAGLLFGALVSTDTIVGAGALVAITMLGLEALKARSPGRTARILGGAALGLLPTFAYQAAVFGSPLASWYTHLSDPQQRAAFAAAQVGVPRPDIILELLFSPRNGLFVVAPIALVGAVALIRLAGHAGHDDARRRLVVVTAGMSLAAVLALATLPRELVFWPFRAEFGPRLLVPILPLLCWPLAALSPRILAPLTFVAAIPHVVAVAIWQPMLNPGATYQIGEVFRRFVWDATTPSIVGLGLPRIVPDRMRVAQVFFVIAVLAALAESAVIALRGAGTQRGAPHENEPQLA